MQRAARLVLTLLFALSVVEVNALAVVNQTVVKLKGARYPADSRQYGGEIVRPQVCPVDSNWLAFEVHDKSEVQLFIFNLETYDSLRINPRREEKRLEEDIVRAAGVDRDLAWRPTKSKDGKIWAAFVGNATGIQELYLYDVTRNKYYLLRSRDDSLGVGKKEGPSWSPDGECLTYTSNFRGNADIYIIRNMDFVLEDPEYPEVPGCHSLLVDDRVAGKGNQFGAIWCPVENAGYIAYIHLDENGERFEIKVFDPLTGRPYGFVGAESDKEFFAPSWSPSGRWLAYLQDDVSDRPLSAGVSTMEELVWKDSYGLGWAEIKTEGDSLIILPQFGGKKDSYTIVDVAPNLDRSLGPAWLPDSKHLLVSLYDEKQQNPFRTIEMDAWRDGTRMKRWLKLFDDAFSYPRDVGIVNDRVAFTYSQEQKRNLLTGRLELKGPYAPLDYLEISKRRQQWWKDYSQRKSAGFLLQAWRWLKTPFAGPNIGVNTPVGLVVATAGYYFVLRPPAGGVDGQRRDWRPPIFPPTPKIPGGGWH